MADHRSFASAMYNATGDLTGEAIAAAERIGASEHAAVFEEFARVGLAGDLTEARDARLETMSEADVALLEALDERFYALPAIDGHLDAYVERNPGEFFRD